MALADMMSATMATAVSLFMGGGIGATLPARAGLRTVPIAGRFAAQGARMGKVTKSSIQLGQQMHKMYKAGSVLKNVRIKEYVIPKSGGKRIDFIDFGTKTIYELKPNNPRAISQGQRQLKEYKSLIEKQFGSGWKTVLDTY
jgi:methyl coenzyme M reductase subunit C